MKTVPDKCPFCESPIMVHVGNLLVSEDGMFATYKCKTIQDIMWSDDQWKRTGQSDGCRRREIQLLTKQRDEARERIRRLEEDLMDAKNKHAALVADVALYEDRGEHIKRLEDIISRASSRFFRDGSNGMVAIGMLNILEEARKL